MARKSRTVPAAMHGPTRTRTAILAAARDLLAREGRDALNVSRVAELAGVNRGTAYLHFRSREALTLATLENVSSQLSRIAFLPLPSGGPTPDPSTWQSAAEELARFAMDNPSLGQIWLNYILSSDRVVHDPFWLKWHGATRRLVESPQGQPGIDVDVLAVILLSAYFTWPTWAEAHFPKKADRPELARRLSAEMIRLIASGVLKTPAESALSPAPAAPRPRTAPGAARGSAGRRPRGSPGR